jgi:hypothetical protein
VCLGAFAFTSKIPDSVEVFHRKSPENSVKHFMIFLLLAGVLVLAGCPKPGGGGSATGGGGVAGGSWGNAKDFTYASYDGTQAKLSSHAGQVTVVNFWAVW